MKMFNVLVVLMTIYFNSFSQDLQYYPDSVYDSHIKSVFFEKSGDRFTFPSIKLNGNDFLILHFDYLSDDKIAPRFSYKIVHCNQDWTPSDLIDAEYINGYPNNFLTEYKSSFNTYTKYFHFVLDIPDGNYNFKLSGNYALVISDEFDSEKIYLIKRFFVNEDMVSINATVRQPVNSQFRYTGQQLEFVVNAGGFYINNPNRDLSADIMQNCRYDNALKFIYPRYINGSSYYFNDPDINLFLGGNEFRYFESKDVKFPSMNTKFIRYVYPYYHFYLEPVEARGKQPYTYREDIDGCFFVKNDRGFDSDVEAEYVWTHFYVKYPEPLPYDVYVVGAFNSWQCSDDYKMEYLPDHKAYHKEVFLKQGLYNFAFFTKKLNEKPDNSIFEGNFYQTENKYTILIYYNDYSAGYDRLIAVTTINSLEIK